MSKSMKILVGLALVSSVVAACSRPAPPPPIVAPAPIVAEPTFNKV